MTGKFLTTIAATWCLAFPLFAQEAPGTSVELRLLAFNGSVRQKEAFVHDPTPDASTEAVMVSVKGYLNQEFTKVMLKSRKLVVTTKADRGSLAREGERIAEVTLPDGVKSALLLFLPGKQGEKGLCQVMAINDSKQAFPGGSYHVTNLSPVPVRLLFEGKPHDLKPGQVSIIDDIPARNGMQFGMSASILKDGAWKVVSTSIWPHPGIRRSVLVMFQNPANGEIQLRGFDDSAPREPAAPVQAAP
jgi:hypothetical protein